MERQAKDGTFYKQVGQDEWEVVTRQAKDGTVYKKVGQDEWSPLEEQKRDISKLESFARASGQGLSFGFSDELIAGTKSAYDDIKAIITGENANKNGAIAKRDELGRVINSDELQGNYEEYRDEEREKNRKAQEANPNVYAAGEAAGGIATAFVPGLGALNAAKGAKLASVAGKAALGGGLTSAGLSEADNLKDFSKDVAIGTGTGAVVGGAMHGAGKLFQSEQVKNFTKNVGKKLANLEKSVIKKSGKIFAGVPEETTERYIKNPNIITNAKTREELSDELAKYADDYASKFDIAKEALDEAKDDFRMQKFNASQEVLDARQALQNRVNEIDQVVDIKAVSKIRHDILDDIQYLKEQVSEGSSKAYKVLDKENGVINVRPIINELDNGISSLKVNGTPISDSAAKSLTVLEKSKERVMALGDDVTFPQAKDIIKQLDDDIKYSTETGSFAPQADAIKAKVRHVLDTILKENSPAYKRAMEPVAKQTELLSKLSSGFGNETKVLNRLANITSVKGKEIDQPLLNELEKLAKSDYSQLRQYIKLKDTLSNPITKKKLISKTPEYQNLQKILKNKEELSKPEAVKNYIKDKFENYKTAKDDNSFYKNFNKNNVENKIKSFSGERNYGSKQLFNELDDRLGTDYSKEVQATNDLGFFNRADTQGSRKTLAGALAVKAAEGVIGGAIGYGATGDSTGLAAGALGGMAMDKYAGQIFKKLLDGRTLTGKNIQKLGKFSKPLMDAASRGNQALAATHYVLQQQNPEYREKMKQLKEEGAEDEQ